MAVVKTIYLENMNEEEKKESYLEGKILEKLDHPNIIKFREVYLTKKPKLTLCIVMDFADGGDLQSKIKSQKGKFFNENISFLKRLPDISFLWLNAIGAIGVVLLSLLLQPFMKVENKKGDVE